MLIRNYLILFWSRGDDSWIELGSQDSKEIIESKVSRQGLNNGTLASFIKIRMTSPSPEIWFQASSVRSGDIGRTAEDM